MKDILEEGKNKKKKNVNHTQTPKGFSKLGEMWR